MAKVGYIFKADLYEGFDADKEWMQQYGCIQIVEESVEHESLRPQWKQLISKLERGDEIIQIQQCRAGNARAGIVRRVLPYQGSAYYLHP